MSENLKGHDALKYLEQNGKIKSYHYSDVDENGDEGLGEMRNSQKLVLIFCDGLTLIIDTECSGVLENTEMFIELSQDAPSNFAIDLQKRLGENAIAQQGKESHVGD